MGPPAAAHARAGRARRAAPLAGRIDAPRVVLALALVLALVRFWRLGAWSLWLDEALTWADYHHALGGQIANPLGYMAVGGAVELLGGEPTELALRLVPALAGWLCVPLAYWAFRGPAGRERAAVAALLLAVSSWHVFWSQSARFYTLAQGAALVGAGVWARGILAGGVWRALAGLAVVGAAASFHPTSAFLLPALLLAPFAPRLAGRPLGRASERAAARLLLAGAVVGLAASPWAWRWLQHHAEQKPLAEPAHLALTAGYWFTPLLLAAALLGVLRVRPRRGEPPASSEEATRDAFALVAGAVALVAFCCALGVSLVAQMTAQYVFVLLPWVALCAATLVAGERAGVRRAPAFALVALLALPALADTALLLTRRHGGRARWREAYEYVAERRRPGDLVLGHGSKLGEFYLGQGATDLRKPVRVSPLEHWFPHAPRHWNRHERTVWVVYRPQWLLDLRPEDRVVVERWLREECRLVERFPVEAEGRELDLEVYRRR